MKNDNTVDKATLALKHRLIVYAGLLDRIVKGYWHDNPTYCEHCTHNVGGQTTRGDHALGCPVKLAQVALVSSDDQIAALLVRLSAGVE